VTDSTNHQSLSIHWFTKFIALLAVVGCSKPDLQSPQTQESYALGREVGESLLRQEIKIDEQGFLLGFRDGLKNAPAKLDPSELAAASMRARQQAMRKFQDLQAQAAEYLRKSEAYLAENKKKPEVKTTASGLQYEILTQGKGAKPKDKQMVEVHFEGRLADGTVFDSSRARNQPAEFNIQQVLQGWSEVLKLMPSGSKWRVTIPPALGYKEAGMPPKIPPNAVLIFELELLRVWDGPKAK
jgi:FKBP-type peptidyl-prolyl cis-trans isomerase